MFNVCPRCGEYNADKIIEPDGPYAVCPHCDYRHEFLRLPLFVITGASGVGKTTMCLTLVRKAKDFVVMDSDILWDKEFDEPETNYRKFRETWLRICKNISQSGKPVILCGLAVPNQFEQCVERRYFSDIFYLALVCDDDALAARLGKRPAWRGTAGPENLKKYVALNRWFKEHAQSTHTPMSLLDTTELTVDESVDAIMRWLSEPQKGTKNF
jgi:2-phosphoglycerate kinase